MEQHESTGRAKLLIAAMGLLRKEGILDPNQEQALIHRIGELAIESMAGGVVTEIATQVGKRTEVAVDITEYPVDPQVIQALIPNLSPREREVIIGITECHDTKPGVSFPIEDMLEYWEGTDNRGYLKAIVSRLNHKFRTHGFPLRIQKMLGEEKYFWQTAKLFDEQFGSVA